MSQERAPIYDKKYRNSFKKHREHTCLITGHVWQEFDSLGVDAAHISIERYGKNIKDDSLILPLRHDLHLEMDKHQPEFIAKYFDQFPADLIMVAMETVKMIDNRVDLTGVVKQLARNYYEDWNKLAR